MENVIQNNRLIAEFMGARIELRDGSYYVYTWDTPNRHFQSRSVNWDGTPEETLIKLYESVLSPEHGRWGKFHSDWNQLMPVVLNINNTLRHGNPEIRLNKRVEVLYSPLTADGEKEQKLFKNWDDLSINSVFEAVVQFIKWHNQNPQPNESN